MLTGGGDSPDNFQLILDPEDDLAKITDQDPYDSQVDHASYKTPGMHAKEIRAFECYFQITYHTDVYWFITKETEEISPKSKTAFTICLLFFNLGLRNALPLIC